MKRASSSFACAECGYRTRYPHADRFPSWACCAWCVRRMRELDRQAGIADPRQLALAL